MAAAIVYFKVDVVGKILKGPPIFECDNIHIIVLYCMIKGILQI